MPIETINPATGELIERFDEHSDSIIESKLNQAEKAFTEWKDTSFETRSALMKSLANKLRENSREYANIITLEMGKPVLQAVGEVEKCAWVCDFYADNAEKLLSNRVVKTDSTESFVRYDPIGAVLAVMPWNFPLWQVFRFLAPALMAGNVGVLKHASNVPKAALLIEKMLLEVGFPEGVFSTLLISSSKVEQVIRDKRIRAVTLTGSEPAGKAVASISGSALKKTVLELGGSDPFVVLADADVETAAKMAASSRMLNAGQSCIAAKRFIIDKSVVSDFTNYFSGFLKAMKIGDPMDESVEIGPMARVDLRDELHQQVKASLNEGANLLLGGELMEGNGAFYPATLLANVTDQMTAFNEETFGPVAPIILAENEQDAILKANQSRFGLGGALWTADIEKGKTLAAKIDTGSVFINWMTVSDPRLPFGGVKDSGYGRELSDEGIREFVNVKTVVVK